MLTAKEAKEKTKAVRAQYLSEEKAKVNHYVSLILSSVERAAHLGNVEVLVRIATHDSVAADVKGQLKTLGYEVSVVQSADDSCIFNFRVRWPLC